MTLQTVTLLTIVKMTKIEMVRHITRSSGLVKTVLQGTVPGGRKRQEKNRKINKTIKKYDFKIKLRSKPSRQLKQCHNKTPHAKKMNDVCFNLPDKFRYDDFSLENYL